ncbi:glyoxylase [Vibrio cholerae HC-49A2]|nr:glyoxylase [Vibrio cholerae HC-49A2]
MSKVVQQQIGNIALVVENYDDAIEFYTKSFSSVWLKIPIWVVVNVGFKFRRQTRMERTYFLLKQVPKSKLNL